MVALMMDWVWIGLPSRRISVLFMQGTHQVREKQTQIGGPSLLGKTEDLQRKSIGARWLTWSLRRPH